MDLRYNKVNSTKKTADELIHRFASEYFDPSEDIVLTNHYVWSWEADLLVINSGGLSHEYEFKTSRADLRNDFKKAYENGGRFHLKHDKISTGDYSCNFFSFVIPDEMYEFIGVPDHLGIVTFYHHPDTWQMQFRRRRSAAQIHSDSFWKLHDQRQLLKNLSNKVLHLKRNALADKYSF